MKFLSYIEIFLGSAVLYGLHHKETKTPHESVGLMLGYILVFVGLSYVIWNEEISLELDPDKKIIHYRKKNILKKKEKQIPFKEVRRIFTQRLGKASHFTEFYFISLELNTNEIISTGKRYADEKEALKEVESLTSRISDG